MEVLAPSALLPGDVPPVRDHQDLEKEARTNLNKLICN